MFPCTCSEAASGAVSKQLHDSPALLPTELLYRSSVYLGVAVCLFHHVFSSLTQFAGVPQPGELGLKKTMQSQPSLGFYSARLNFSYCHEIDQHRDVLSKFLFLCSQLGTIPGSFCLHQGTVMYTLKHLVGCCSPNCTSESIGLGFLECLNSAVNGKRQMTMKSSRGSSYTWKPMYMSQVHVTFSGSLKSIHFSQFECLGNLGTGRERAASLHS